MQSRISLSVFLVVCLMFLFSPPLANADSNGLVSESTAKIAIERYIEGNSSLTDLNGSQIILKHKFYQVDDTLGAYYFELKKKSDSIGYFIVSANELIDPILQYSIGGNLDYYLDKYENGDKIYYFGVNKFRFAKDKEDLQNEFKKSKSLTLDLLMKNGVKKSDPIFKKVKIAKLKSIEKKTNSKEEWKSLLNGKKDESENLSNDGVTTFGVVTPEAYKVLLVDRIWQRRTGINNPDTSCGPTVGAMIMDYYYDVWGYNIRDNAYYGSWANLVDHMYSDMDSGSFGTYLNDFRDGLYSHVLETSSASAWRVYSDSSPLYADLRNAIISNDPLGLQSDFFMSSDSDLSKYHWVTAIGYDDNSGNYKVAYKDPDNGEYNDATHWFDWSSNVADLDMAWLR